MSEPIALTTTEKTASQRWLGLGREIHATTVEEVLEQGGLDWTVSKRPIATTSFEMEKDEKTGNPILLGPNGIEYMDQLLKKVKQFVYGEDETEINRSSIKNLLDLTEEKFIPHTEDFAIVRNDTNKPFGVMGRIYECLSNAQCIEMIKPLLDNDQAEIERVGYFNDGANCWVIARFPESISIGPEKLDQYMKLSWSHDGTEKLSATFIALHPKTNTQINPEIPGAQVSIEIRHTTNAPERILVAKELLSKGHSYFKVLEENLENLMGIPFSDEEMEKYLEAIIPDAKNPKLDDKTGMPKQTRASLRRDEILGIFRTSDSDINSTKYAAYSAVAQWCDHDKAVRVTGQDEAEGDEEKLEEMNRETRLKGIWMKAGSARKLKNDAFKKLIKS